MILVLLSAAAITTVLVVKKNKDDESPSSEKSSDDVYPSSVFEEPERVTWKGSLIPMPNVTEYFMYPGMVAVSGDGSILAVTTFNMAQDLESQQNEPGWVDFFRWDNATESWQQQQQQRLYPPSLIHDNIPETNASAISGFGRYVKMSGNGRRLVVRSFSSIFTYDFDDLTQTWSLAKSAHMIPPLGEEWNTFSSQLNDDGLVLAVGKYHDLQDDSRIVYNSGAIYIYHWSKTMQLWELNYTIYGNSADDMIGRAMVLSANGQAILSTNRQKSKEFFSSGFAWVWHKQMNNTWTQAGEGISGLSTNSELGATIGISADGKIIALLSPGYLSGATLVYEFTPQNTWELRGSPLPNPIDLYDFDLCMARDGNFVVVSSSTMARAFQYQAKVDFATGTDGHADPQYNWVQVGNFSSTMVGNRMACSTTGHVAVMGNAFHRHVQVWRAVEQE